MKKKVILTIFQAGVTLAILYLVFHDPEKRREMLELFEKSDKLWLLLGFALYGITEAVGVYRWQLLLRVQGIHLGLGRLCQLVLIGIFFNYFIPGGTGGDLVRLFYLVKETPGKGPLAVLSVLVDRLIGLMALVVLTCFLLAIRWSWLTKDPDTAKAVWVVLIILGASVNGLGFTVVVSRFNLAHRFPAWLPGRERIAEMALAYKLYAKAWRTSLAALVISMACHMGYFGMFYCPALSFRASHVKIPSFLDLCAIMPVVNTISAMPISIGGLGVREGLFKVFLGRLADVPDKVAVMMSSSGYLLTLAWGLIGGIVYLFYRSGHHARMQEIASQVTGLEHEAAETELAMETAAVSQTSVPKDAQES